jgi:hypothetical protein
MPFHICDVLSLQGGFSKKINHMMHWWLTNRKQIIFDEWHTLGKSENLVYINKNC